MNLLNLKLFKTTGFIVLVAFALFQVCTFNVLAQQLKLTNSNLELSGISDNILVSNLIDDEIKFDSIDHSILVIYTLSYLGVSGELSITCPNYLSISFDGENWQAHLSHFSSEYELIDVWVRLDSLINEQDIRGAISHKLNDVDIYQIDIKVKRN